MGQGQPVEKKNKRIWCFMALSGCDAGYLRDLGPLGKSRGLCKRSGRWVSWGLQGIFDPQPMP